MNVVKSLLSTLAGWAAGYLLPGLALLYVMSWWSDYFASVFKAFLEPSDHFSLLVLTLLAATLCGKQLSVLSWVIYDRIICRGVTLFPVDDLELEADGRHELYDSIINRYFRHHQILAGLSVLIPVIGFSWLYRNWVWLSEFERSGALVGLTIVESSTFMAAVTAYHQCASRITKLFNMQSLGSENERKVVDIAEHTGWRKGS